MSEHSKVIGGSSASRVLNCPGSVKLSADIPSKTSSYAEKGTALHEALTHCLQTNMLPRGIKGQVFNGYEITDELIHEKLTPALMAVVELAEQAGGPVDMLNEKRVAFCPGETDTVENADIFGTCDLMLRKPGTNTLYVIDFKFGDGVPVTAFENDQLLFYAGCAMYTKGDDELAKLVKGVDKFVGAIIQPGMGDVDYTTYEFTDETVEAWLDKMDVALQSSEQDNPPLELGDHCRWCPAKTKCPKQVEGLSVLASPSELVTGETHDVIAEYLEMAVHAENMIKALREEAIARLEAGDQIPGWQLKPKRATRRWVNTDAAETMMINAVGSERAYVTKLVSPTQAEKVLGKKEYKKIAAEYVAAVSSGMNLTRAAEHKTEPAIQQEGLVGLSLPGKPLPAVEAPVVSTSPPVFEQVLEQAAITTKQILTPQE